MSLAHNCFLLRKRIAHFILEIEIHNKRKERANYHTTPRLTPLSLTDCTDCAYLCPGVSVVLTPLEPKVLLGDSVALTCSAEGGSSPEEEELEWHREGALVKLDDHNRYTPSRLCVQNVTRQDHLVTFTCHLKRNFTITTHVTVKVRCE